MKLKNILYIICALPLLWGCNDEDDVNEIFVSGTWYVVNYFTKADWDKRNGEPVYKPITGEGQDALKVIQLFTLTFSDDGTYKGTMQNANFDGTWSADGKDHSLRLTVKGSPNTSSRFNKELIETLKEVAYYQGDSNYLMLGPSDKRSYIQIRHN
ncbi:MAG: DUF4847 family protein [Bacteroides sp.]|nr:DUF4847 family protein [Bacteroides sp.]